MLHRTLLDRAVVTSEQACRLARETGTLTATDLAAALDDGRVAASLGDGLAARLDAVRYPDGRGDGPLTPGRAWDLMEALLPELASVPSLSGIEPSGDLRRALTLLSTVVLVGSSPDPGAAMDAIAARPQVTAVTHRSAARLVFTYREHEIDLRLPPDNEFGSVLFATTGPGAHCRAIRARGAGSRAYATEEALYAAARLPWIPPELRDAPDAIASALAGTLPRLIEQGDIRGDLHMHTRYSDGRDTLDQMVTASAALGYEYIAITDHSEGAGASRTLAARDVPRQRREIDRLRARFPGLGILHGVEVDILPDGSLDFPDDLLAGFDIVLASLHDRAGQDGPELTRRCLAALRHPLVNVLTHPANRLPGRHEGHPLDFEAVYEAAATTGTALEVDGAPGHLDLDGERARAAIQAGATLVVDSDCHRATSLERKMRLGAGLARRGWAEPRHVLNARPLSEVRAFVAAKRL